MRTEKEMFDLVLGVAARDDRVRAVTLEGSRTNPNVPKDLFQDYDVSYRVTEMDSFLRHPEWIDVFGERIDLKLIPLDDDRRVSAYLDWVRELPPGDRS